MNQSIMLSTLNLYNKPIVATVCIAFPLFGGVLSGGAQSEETWIWYRNLRKPSWTPPNWLFGPAWTFLYLSMGYASYRVLESTHSDRNLALGLYGVQLALNFIWSPLFFKFKQLGWAAIEIVTLWSTIVATAAVFFEIDETAGFLFLPYIAWVSFATSLNLSIWWKNRSVSKKD